MKLEVKKKFFLAFHHFSPHISSLSIVRHHCVTMPATKHDASAGDSPARNDSLKPNNPLQADFDSETNSQMDADERYLVRLLQS